jgi:hypothetical protein
LLAQPWSSCTLRNEKIQINWTVFSLFSGTMCACFTHTKYMQAQYLHTYMFTYTVHNTEEHTYLSYTKYMKVQYFRYIHILHKIHASTILAYILSTWLHYVVHFKMKKHWRTYILSLHIHVYIIYIYIYICMYVLSHSRYNSMQPTHKHTIQNWNPTHSQLQFSHTK